MTGASLLTALTERAQRNRREIDNAKSQYLAECYARAARKVQRKAQTDLFPPKEATMRYALTVAAVLFSGSALAQVPQACGPRLNVVKLLEGQYQEKPVAVGIADGGHLLEVFASKDGATWTLLSTLPSGTSCLMATGHDWQTAPQPTSIAEVR